ncbi:MAG: acyltransferase [Pyrinomonadaceae bacterium]|nr:acyltransferase [Pyrinomonadaceae bacterium]
MAEALSKPDNRIPSLDGLRTVSIALVLIGHAFHVYGLGTTGNFGNLGVRVFFVISGFLITGLLVREIERTSTVNLLKFYFRRTLRIFPPYYFYLGVIGIAAALGLAAVPLASLVYSSAYLTDYVAPTGWLLGHTWSLAVEEQFYLILPGFLMLLGIRRAKALLIAIVMLAPIVRVLDFWMSGPDQIWVLKGFHANADALAIGCLLSLFRDRLHRLPAYRRFLGSRIVFLLLPVILLANLQGDHPLVFLGASLTLMNIAVALCIDWSVTNHSTVTGRFLNSPVMVRLGVMSYSIYLWQQPFLNPHDPGLLTSFPLNLIGIAVMSSVSYYFVEKYSLAWRQKLEARWFRPRNQGSGEPEPSPATA